MFMGKTQKPVNGTITVEETNEGENDVVFRVRTADNTDILVSTSSVATEQLRNKLDSVLEEL